MIEKHGNLFDTDARYIGHGVNTVGLMGAGIAKQFKYRYPQNYDTSKGMCENGLLTPGHFLVTMNNEGTDDWRLVVNFASQGQPGPNATYKLLLTSLLAFSSKASREERLNLYGNRVAIPEIGCGIGGLEWEGARTIIEAVETIHPAIEYEVWHYAG